MTIDRNAFGISVSLLNSIRAVVTKSRPDDIQENFVAGIPDAPTARQLGMVAVGGFAHHPSVVEAMLNANKENDHQLVPGYTVRHDLGVNNEHQYTVYTGTKKVGEARLSHTGTHVVDLSINKDHRRKGLATSLYNHIEKELGHKLEPSPTWQTPEGRAFWASRNKVE